MSEDLPQFVVVGGYLLHKVLWLKRATLGDILQQYSNHLASNYGSTAVVVFDGYGDEPSTKNHEHRRRAGNACKLAPEVDVSVSQCILFDQSAFLANKNSKQK